MKLYMKDYRERVIEKSCSADKKENMLKRLGKFHKDILDTNKFYDEVCGDCYACVLASAI